MSVTTCPGCGKPTAAVDFLLQPLRNTWHRLWGGKDHVFKADCPRCHTPFELSCETCPACGEPVDVVALFTDFATPLVDFMVSVRKRAERITPFEAWVIRFSHFVVSISVLGLLMGIAEDRFVNGSGEWFSAAFSTAIYLGMSLLILTWILPPNVAPAFARLKVLTKLSFFLNYLAMVFGIMLTSDHWRARSWLLIGTFASSLVGIWLASRLILPAWATAGGILSGTINKVPEDEAWRGRRKAHRPNRIS